MLGRTLNLEAINPKPLHFPKHNTARRASLRALLTSAKAATSIVFQASELQSSGFQGSRGFACVALDVGSKEGFQAAPRHW